MADSSLTRRRFAALALAFQPSARRAQILHNMQLVMGDWPSHPRTPVEYEVVDAQEREGCRLTLFHYVAEPGDRVPAYLLTPAESKPRMPAVVCPHSTIAIGKGEPAGLGTRENRSYAEELARRGYVTLAPDYPNFGSYKFDPYSRGYLSATMKGIWNHVRAVDLLEAQPEVDGRRIGAVGHSLGGHNALFLAAFDERVRAVVTSCGFTSFRRYMGGDLTGWSHRGYMPRIASLYAKSPALMPFDFDDVLEAIAPRAVFVNAPLRDDNFDAGGVDEAVEAAQRRARTRITVRHPDAGHDFPPDVREEAYQWLDRELGRVD